MTRRTQAGSATAWTALLVGALTTIAVAFAGAAGAVVGLRQAQAAADLAALAAAGAPPGSGCRAAARIAARNGSRLESCEQLADADVRVVVTVRVAGPWPESLTVRGRARAGRPR